MAEVIVDGAPHNPAPVVVPKTSEGDEVVLSKEEHTELTRKAEVSSQNFERLKKEQERREELEAELALLRDTVPSDIDTERVRKLEAAIADIQAKETKREVLETYPQLKDLGSEFDSFRDNPDNKGMNLKTAAKAFLTEKGLIESAPRRGLERPTGGDRQPVVSGMSVEEAETLRKTDFRRYREMLKKGQLKVNYNS